MSSYEAEEEEATRFEKEEEVRLKTTYAEHILNCYHWKSWIEYNSVIKSILHFRY